MPLVSVVFGTMYFYNAREFIELLLAQPVGRRSLFTGLTWGWRCRWRGAFLAGWGSRRDPRTAEPALCARRCMLLIAGVLLTFVFTAVAFLAGVRFDDRAKGLGGAILVWFCCAVLYDGVILLVAIVPGLSARAGAGLTLLNPIDLARVLLLLTFDTAALMGYTGAVFERFFGTGLGIAAAGAALLLWTGLPFLAGLRGFNRKDF